LGARSASWSKSVVATLPHWRRHNKRVASAAQAAVTSGTSVRFDLRPFGETPRYLSILAFPIVAVGRPARLGWLAQDVTRERELERLKDELIATVSHELRTPLSSLVGFSELLLTA